MAIPASSIQERRRVLVSILMPQGVEIWCRGQGTPKTGGGAVTSSADFGAAASAMVDGGPALWLASGECPTSLPESVGAVVETSGSTGPGRRVVLSRAALRAAAAQSRQVVGRDLTWHLVLSPKYVAGLMVLLRSLAAGRAPIPALASLADLCATGNGDAVSIVGTQLFRALQDPNIAHRLARFDLVLVGGGALAPELRERALQAGIALRETYGMSETCGGIVWDGVLQPGSSVEIQSDARAPLGGRIALGGPTLCDGYLLEDGSIEPATVDGLLITSDWGYVEDARLVVGGRLDDVVISGGVNVDLAAVRRAVESLDPGAAVLAVDDPEWGRRIVVFAASGTLAQWRDRLAPLLGRASLPRQVVTVSALPRTPGGKPDRRALLALVPQ